MAEKHVEHGARAAYASWRERLGSATTWNELAPAAQITWLNVARAVLDSQQPKDDRPVWGQGADCPHRPEWHCESHGECRGCECGCDTVNPPLEALETSDTDQCGDPCICADTCALNPDHDGIHRSADGVCGWTQDHSWYGPAKTYDIREGLKDSE